MPGTIQDLKNRLTRAIDAEGNVRDIAAVVEVVSILEQTTISAEDLQATRLGKCINDLRRRTADRSLARRMKSLVKTWQRLVQSHASHNGLLQAPVNAGASATAPLACSPPLSPLVNSSSTLQDPSSPTMQPKRTPGRSQDALMHRRNLLVSKLSAVKKSSLTCTSPTSQTSSLAIPSIMPPVLPALSNPLGAFPPIEPVVTSSGTVPAYSPITPVTPLSLMPVGVTLLPKASDASLELSNGFPQPCTSSQSSSSSLPLIISLPISYFSNARSKDTNIDISTSSSYRNSSMVVDQKSVTHPIAGKKLEAGGDALSLIVTIPRASVRLSCTRRSSFSPISSVSGSLSPLQVPTLRPETLLVTLDRTLLPCGNSISATDPVRKPPGTVSFDGALNGKLVPGLNRLKNDEEPTDENSYLISASTLQDEHYPGAFSPSPSAPTGRLKGPSVVGVPTGYTLGVDGCLGANGLWHDWTEAVLSERDSAVNVLPYVYVDGWDLVTTSDPLDNIDQW